MDKRYGVWAVRSAASMFGAAQAWCKEEGEIIGFASKDDAQGYADRLNGSTTANVHYFVKEIEPSIIARLKAEKANTKPPQKAVKSEQER